MKNISTEDLINYCFRKKKSLTPSRTLIIKTLSKYSKPKSAYELHEELNKNSSSKINISTIYRVLEFWIELGLIHKISSINKYLLTLTSKYSEPLAFIQENVVIMNFEVKIRFFVFRVRVSL